MRQHKSLLSLLLAAVLVFTLCTAPAAEAGKRVVKTGNPG